MISCTLQVQVHTAPLRIITSKNQGPNTSPNIPIMLLILGALQKVMDAGLQRDDGADDCGLGGRELLSIFCFLGGPSRKYLVFLSLVLVSYSIVKYSLV